MAKQAMSARESAANRDKPRKTWQQKVFIVLSVLLIISWIAALLVSL